MRTLVIANQKGGVGKSAVGVHLAYAAVERRLSVLLVDLDRQGSLSMTFAPAGDDANALHASDLFAPALPRGRGPLRIAPGLALIPADDRLSLLHANGGSVERMPAKHLRALADGIDLCIIDTPGAIGFNPPMTVAALIAADAVVCPFTVGRFESKALADLWAYLRSIKTPAYNPKLRLLGLIPSKIHTRSTKQLAALEELRKTFGTSMLPGMLAERTPVHEAIMRGRPVWVGTRGASHLAAANEWRAMCDHVLDQTLGSAR